MMQLQLGWRPFLGQVPFPQAEESRSEKVARFNKELDSIVGVYSATYPLDRDTPVRLEAMVANCRAVINRIWTDPDVDAAESSASKCVYDTDTAFFVASREYVKAAASAASAGVATSAIVVGLLGAASIGVSAYHGYKRNNSTGWAVWWGFMGALFPVITPAVAIAQGFGKRERK